MHTSTLNQSSNIFLSPNSPFFCQYKTFFSHETIAIRDTVFGMVIGICICWQSFVRGLDWIVRLSNKTYLCTCLYCITLLCTYVIQIIVGIYPSIPVCMMLGHIHTTKPLLQSFLSLSRHITRSVVNNHWHAYRRLRILRFLRRAINQFDWFILEKLGTHNFWRAWGP